MAEEPKGGTETKTENGQERPVVPFHINPMDDRKCSGNQSLA
jgi:hypothetical protein